MCQWSKIYTHRNCNRVSKSGYESELKIYECEKCDGCTLKNKCTKVKGNRRIQVFKVMIEHRKKSTENITSELGKQLRMNRSIQIERDFGLLKNNMNFNRFLTKGIKNIENEFRVLMFAANINKLHKKIIKSDLGLRLYEIKEKIAV